LLSATCNKAASSKTVPQLASRACQWKPQCCREVWTGSSLHRSNQQRRTPNQA
jgi:hypothetical protein